MGWTGRVDAASDSLRSSSAPGNTVGIAWRDDDVFGTRLHRSSASFRSRRRAQFPSEMVAVRDWKMNRRVDGSGMGTGPRLAFGALARVPAALGAWGILARRSLARRTSRTSPRFDRTRRRTRIWSPYLDAALERFPGNTPGEPFVAAVRRWRRRGRPGSRLAAEAARRVVRRAEALDALANVAGSNPNPEPIGAGRVRGERLGEARERARRRRRRRTWCSVSSRSSITRRAGTRRRVRGGGDGCRSARVRIPVGADRGVRGPGGRGVGHRGLRAQIGRGALGAPTALEDMTQRFDAHSTR